MSNVIPKNLKKVVELLNELVDKGGTAEPGSAIYLFAAAICPAIGAVAECETRNDLQPLVSLINHQAEWVQARELLDTSGKPTGKTVGQSFDELEAVRLGLVN